MEAEHCIFLDLRFTIFNGSGPSLPPPTGKVSHIQGQYLVEPTVEHFT